MSDFSHSKEGPRRLGFVFALFGGLWVFTILLASQSDSIQNIVERIDQGILFRLRAQLVEREPLHDKIKIFVMDDSTLAWNNNQPNLSLEDWTLLLQNFSGKDPQVILIDKIFGGNAYIEGHPEVKNKKRLLNEIRHIKTPIYIGAYPYGKLKHKHEIDIFKGAYTSEHFFNDKKAPDFIPPSRNDINVYGHSHHFDNVFKGVGYLNYEATGFLSIYPFKNIRNHLLPALSIYGASTIDSESGVLKLNNTTVPMDSLGRIYINHRKPHEFRPIRLKKPLMRARQKIPESMVEQGDVVFIIPAFYTGAADIHEGGPFGAIPGGFIHAQMLDSIISGEWLKVWDHNKAFIILTATLGALIGFLAGPITFWFYMTGYILGYFVTIVGLFCYFQQVIPLVFPLLAALGSSLASYAQSSWQREIKRILLRQKYETEKSKRLEEEAKKKLLEERISLGKAVQEMLLPKKMSGSVGSFQYHMRYLAAQQMSGDWLYLWEASNTESRIILGDVVGKGPSAALAVAIIINEIKTAEEQRLTMEATIKRINNTLMDHFHGKVTTTLASATVYQNYEINFHNAGSPGWFLQQEGEPLKILSLRSNPLGVNRNIEPIHEYVKLDRKSVFFTFSDGYMEGARASKRLMRTLRNIPFAELDHELIHSKVLEVGEGHRLDDDMTMVSIISSP